LLRKCYAIKKISFYYKKTSAFIKWLKDKRKKFKEEVSFDTKSFDDGKDWRDDETL
jgi:hypothetical protein